MNNKQATAQFHLGLCYAKGYGGLKVDKVQATKWYTQAAEQGYLDAQFNLALLYYRGDGVLQDYRAAHAWFIQAANQGDADAQHALGVMYYNGEGIPQDFVLAYLWFNIAAALSDEIRAKVSKYRDRLTRWMSANQLDQAQQLSRDWFAEYSKEGKVTAPFPRYH